MKRWVVIVGVAVICLLGGLKLWKDEKESLISVEGTVLEVSGTGALVSERDNLSLKDLVKTYDEWMKGDYDLIFISNLNDIEVGMVIKVIVEDGIAESYPARAKAKSYEVIKQIELTKESEETIGSKESFYSQQLVEIFPQKMGLQQLFSGYAEYGHVQTLKEAHETETTFELLFEGEMRDGRGDSERRFFQLTYEFTDEAVIEHVQNSDPYNQLHNSKLFNSIIPNKVILKLPLEVGNSWDETFSYRGQEYTARTEIIRVDSLENGEKEYETLTSVKGIEEYYNECYKENRVFRTNRGMTSFSNLFSLELIDVDNQELEQSEDLYLFGYYLSAEQ